MKQGRIGIAALLVCALALAACGEAKPVETSRASDTGPIEAKNPFFGTWEMTTAKVAPWWDEKGDTPAADPTLSTISFAAAKATGSPLLTCETPRYAVSLAPTRSLFEGNLADPAKQAAALGFPPGDVTILNYSCESGSRDVSLDFPMIDTRTIMLGLDNVIYTFKRTGN